MPIFHHLHYAGKGVANSNRESPHSPLPNHQSPLTNHHSPLTNHHSPATTPQSPVTSQTMRCRRQIYLLIILQLVFCHVHSEPATSAPLAVESLLLDVTSAPSLTVVVGERGHILYSKDNRIWTQASVDTSSLLTAVYMLDDTTGWAVGHNAVIVKTTDGARTWQLVHESDTDEAPLLDIYFSDAENGIAIGAYGLYYVTEDGGDNWQQQDIAVQNEEIFEMELMQPFDLHLNAIAAANGQRLYMAAERGYVLRSDNGGTDWTILTTPYHGSYFGLLPLSNDNVILFGLRGRLYHTTDAGTSWNKIKTDTMAMLTDAVILNDQRIIISGMAGTLLSGSKDDLEFKLVPLAHRHDFSSLVHVGDQLLLVTGEEGIDLIDLDRLAREQ